jgi:hypothetical protein
MEELFAMLKSPRQYECAYVLLVLFHHLHRAMQETPGDAADRLIVDGFIVRSRVPQKLAVAPSQRLISSCSQTYGCFGLP